ncbi:tetratricopeptide repeat protein [Myxococcota bacterium]|nr:tetratricopeptide repeat protein [Myxococcota bacterium]
MMARRSGRAVRARFAPGRGLRTAARWVAAIGVVVGLVGGPVAFAVEQDDTKAKTAPDAKAEARAKAKKQKEVGGNFNERNLKKIIKMKELWDAGDNAAAKAILESINAAREKPYGQSKIFQFLGMFAQEDGEYDKAIEYMNKSVEAGGLTAEEEDKVLFQVGMLQMKQERYDDAIATIERWMEVTPQVTGQSYYTLAIAYYQAGKGKQALAPAKKAVEMSENPPESWYRLLLAMYLEQEMFDEGIELLDTMILKYPNETYWTQLAALYSSKDKMDRSLAVQQLAKYEGYITKEKDLTRMAQMFMVQGLPHRGAAIMKKGLEDGSIPPSKMAYQTYSDTLLQSREWELALDPIARAAELSEDGSLWVRHAQVHLQVGNWSGARESLNKAFQKGNIPDEGQAHILFGIAAAYDKQWDAASSAFKRAANYPGTTDVAVKWMAFVDREKFRFASPEEQAKMAAERAAKEAEAGGAAAASGEAAKPADAKPGTTTQASAGAATDAKAAADAKANASSRADAAKASAKN